MSVQMTIGARLDRLEELRKTIAKAKSAGRMVTPAFNYWARTHEHVLTLMPLIEAKVGSAHKPGFWPSKTEKLQALLGATGRRDGSSPGWCTCSATIWSSAPRPRRAT